nr:hypothetical protein [Polymorphobacter sp.]
MTQLLLVELNEINFELVEKYAAAGDLPTFARFLGQHGYTETTSEADYEHLEPWIQWVTAHTGLSFADHGVFRLGDIVKTDHPQIWERLEAKGLRVGAVSPMNAKYRLENPAFFVPDPWTPTGIAAPASVKRLYAAISQAVNDNAEAKITPGSALAIALASAKSLSLDNADQYVGFVLKSVRQPWFRAMYLDLLLADVFAKSVATTRPDFASLFLNAGAHIQHHYMFSSRFYDGPFRNPEWYVAADGDPIADIYKLYDRLLGRLLARFPTARIMLATGLHQDPHPELQYYWRLKDHAAFLDRIGVGFTSIEPRMSRDFVVHCANADDAAKSAEQLARAVADDGQPLFSIDNRGDSLFVEFVYPSDISATDGFRVGNTAFDGLRDAVAFVAIKNGQHNGIGYFSDSAMRLGPGDRFALKDLPDRIEAALAPPQGMMTKNR